MSNSRLKISVGFRVSNSEAIDDERVLVGGGWGQDVYSIYRHTDRHIYMTIYIQRFLCSSLRRESIQFDKYFFSGGWFNHELDI